ncbi:uncharacterized protein AB675_11308 [Cyphellophora attinorum]|uniref:Uncharacterized protein n=1 Tax=Cyphellophora attinorum TaxID=1664694 RepID=A0A0N1P0F2_9EURO|nr:uncharacterized protein AB675_11308 [Phialophora attinorum]KPI39923.1 hypothetical protein AB675_11308 [Phialophora attinorum]
MYIRDRRPGRRPIARQFQSGAALEVFEVSTPRKKSKQDVRAGGVSSSGTPPVAPDLLAQFQDLFDGIPFEHNPEDLRNFLALYDLYVIGPTFAPSFRSAFQRAFFSGPDLVRDTYPAVQAVMRVARQLAPKPQLGDGVVRSASAMETLRTTIVKDAGEAFSIVALGQCLAAFDLMTSASGVDLILQYSLSSALPFYDNLSTDPYTDPVLITSIFWNTILSLIKGKMPVIRYQAHKPCVVDRIAGICTPLLPILHDLCRANVKARSGTLHDEGKARLKAIEYELTRWTPPCIQLESSYTADEAVIMKGQAVLYRSAALLVLHRIDHPFSQHDGVARALADTILVDFKSHSQLLNNDGSLQHVSFPLLMAALELEDFPHSLWETQGLLNATQACKEQLHAFIAYIWTERRSGSARFLSDIVENGPDFVITP